MVLQVRYGQGTQRAGCAATAVLANRLLLLLELLLRAAGQSLTMTPQLQRTDVACTHIAATRLLLVADVPPI